MGNGEISKKALQEYENIDSVNKFEILEWLLKYQDVSAILSNELRKADDWGGTTLWYIKKNPSF